MQSPQGQKERERRTKPRFESTELDSYSNTLPFSGRLLYTAAHGAQPWIHHRQGDISRAGATSLLHLSPQSVLRSIIRLLPASHNPQSRSLPSSHILLPLLRPLVSLTARFAIFPASIHRVYSALFDGQTDETNRQTDRKHCVVHSVVTELQPS